MLVFPRRTFCPITRRCTSATSNSTCRTCSTRESLNDNGKATVSLYLLSYYCRFSSCGHKINNYSHLPYELRAGCRSAFPEHPRESKPNLFPFCYKLFIWHENDAHSTRRLFPSPYATLYCPLIPTEMNIKCKRVVQLKAAVLSLDRE